ncbi:TPA: hypothetical protein QCX75_005053 [Bacillus mycoides]|uniref:DUF2852 domain-containing protein n=1 Tax=Bacillus sp. FSL P2-0099 TaxID=2921572 RepID=UPI0030F71613|nr:hypothetical protein [Bacillus mycoides]
MMGILFTAAPSTDVVKELQDKVISLHEHEVSFLNDTIANMQSNVSIALTIIGGLMTIVLAIIGFTNARAQKRMKEANNKMLEATDKIKDAEKKISDLESKIAEANSVVTQAQSVADFAQDKIDELEKEQEEIKNFAERLESGIKTDAILNAIKMRIDFAKRKLDAFPSKESPQFSKLKDEYINFENQYYKIQFDSGSRIMEDKKLTAEESDKVIKLAKGIARFMRDEDIETGSNE